MDAIDWINLPNGYTLTNKITGDTIIKIANNKVILTTCGDSFEADVVEYNNKNDKTLNYFGIDAKRNDCRSWLPITKRFWA